MTCGREFGDWSACNFLGAYRCFLTRANPKTAINSEKHTVNIAHGAVPTVQWPAMTMAFSATAEQLAGLSVGDPVTFEFRPEGAKATVESIDNVK